VRYIEVLEAFRRNAEEVARDRQKRAREQLAAADNKRAEAARKYQDQLQSARSAAAKARAKLSSIPEAADQLAEGSRSYALRDRNGVLVGWIEAVGRLLQAKDRTGTIIGWYDPRQNQTRDRTGTMIGTGDFLSALLVCKCRR
jgi:DNA-binding protein H-NS